MPTEERTAIPVIDVESLTKGMLPEELLVQRQPQGNHSLQFDGRKYKVGDEVIELRSNGFAYLVKAIMGKAYRSNMPVSPTVIMVKLIALCKVIVQSREAQVLAEAEATRKAEAKAKAKAKAKLIAEAKEELKAEAEAKKAT